MRRISFGIFSAWRAFVLNLVEMLGILIRGQFVSRLLRNGDFYLTVLDTHDLESDIE